MAFKNISDALSAGKSVKFELAILLDSQDFGAGQSGPERLVHLLQKIIADIEDGNDANFTTSDVDSNLYVNDLKQTLVRRF